MSGAYTGPGTDEAS